MQVARPAEASFTNVILVAHGAMLQTGDKLHTTDEGPAPHSTMAVANVQCRAEDVVGSAFKVTCSNGKPSVITDAAEKEFRDRLAQCFVARPVDLPPRTLRALEATIQKGTTPMAPAVRPETTTPFVNVDVDLHIVAKPPLVPIYESECKNVPHPCDAVRLEVVGHHPADPNAKNIESQQHTFVGFGPDGYEVRPLVGSPGPIFRGIGVETIYAAPILEGGKPDVRFVVQRFGPLAWEPPTKVSEDAVKETYARIAAIDPERENDATQIAIFLDRAVLAFAMRDERAAKRHLHELDAWLARHADALPKYDYAKRGLETLHMLERGALSITDPCTK
jgi:hypothetical protein